MIAAQRSRSRHKTSAGLAASWRFRPRGISPIVGAWANADSAAPATVDEDFDFVAKRFCLFVLSVWAALAALPTAFAQDQPVQLHAPAEKSSKPAKTAPAAPLPAAEAVARASAWLDAARVITADFVQIGPDGRRSEGRLSVERPGRMLFQYTDPPRFEVVADGRSVAIIDHKLNTQDEYFIAQTPLKFLLSDNFDIARDTRVLSVAQEGNSVTIEVEDRAALGGTAHISLVFDASTFALRQWTVIDAQGFQTVVTLFDLDLTTKPDPALFHIDESLSLPGNRRR
jgi:outer membrane lipoprotein-sorting protein